MIRSESVESGFHSVDRRFFVPQIYVDIAHTDQPIREGSIHISAPHIYAMTIEELDISPNSSLSFLNIGSGTGYLSCIVASILGKTGVCYGVELQREAFDHCMASVERFKTHGATDSGLAHMEFFCGNGLNIDSSVGESLVGYDRIYVGASLPSGHLPRLASLLRRGGILIAPGTLNTQYIQRFPANE